MNNIKNKNISLKSLMVLVLAGTTAALTIFFRVPTPTTGGYFNFGDMGVVFCGLFLRGFTGALAGGIGSAIADIVGGFFIFAPITFIAKGLEAYIAGTLGHKNPWWLTLGGICMLSVYFAAETFLPGMGLSAALSSLPLNALQALAGAAGGFFIYKGVIAALPKNTLTIK